MVINNNQVPCKDCITFAICSAYVKEMEGNVRPLLSHKNCSLLNEYANNGEYVIEGKVVDEIRIIFGLKPVYEGES